MRLAETTKMMRSKMTSAFRFLLLFAALDIRSAVSFATYAPGTIYKDVVALDHSALDVALKDPANPVWLLKFYAPWCAHCKRLAPVLEKVAPEVSPNMSIGIIDCTLHKSACDSYGVRGYPTLKFSIDGSVYDYPGGRQQQDFINFAEKLNRPAVLGMSSLEEATTYTQTDADEGVTFIAHHADAKGENVEERLQSTKLTQIFGQAARKLRAEGHFLLLDAAAETGDLQSPFVCRLEENVATRCAEISDDIDTPKLLDFLKLENVATVSSLGPHNFNKIGRKGRPLVIAAIDMQVDDQVKEAKMALSTVATSADQKDDYYFGYFDGKQWQKFLSQFDVLPDQLPQVFVLDVPSKTFWQNETYGLDVHKFLSDVSDGYLPSRSAGPKGIQGVMHSFGRWLEAYRPWSVGVVVLLFVALAVGVAVCVTPGEDLRPPYPQDAVAATSPSKENGDSEPTSDTTTDDEPKKDK